MALRRRQGMGRSATFKEDTIYRPPPEEGGAPPMHSSSSSSSLAVQAIMASSAHRDSSHSSASAFKDHHSKGGPSYDYTSMEGSNEAGSFWGILAQKAKRILDDDNTVPYQSEYLSQTQPETVNPSRPVRPETVNPSRPVHQGEDTMNNDNPTLRKGLVALTTSMNRIGDSIGNALEEGRTIVENKTADFMEETRKIQIKRKGNNVGVTSMHNHTSQEDLIKASRDVAMATAAKTKLLLRELKTVKADLTFAKQRCSQLEEENKVLREGREKGVFPGDDDMIRLQLETLLAEKARLAHENSEYECENRFLREIVEYHQLTMQDVVYLDEGIEEVTEVYDYPTQSGRMLSASAPSSPASRRNSVSSSLSRSSSVAKEVLSLSAAPLREKKNINNDAPSA